MLLWPQLDVMLLVACIISWERTPISLTLSLDNDDWSRAQKEDRTLRLDKVLNQNGAVHELEKHEGAVYDAACPLVWQELWLDEGQDGQRKSEENGEDLESNQLWEGFIDVTAVTEAQAEIL